MMRFLNYFHRQWCVLSTLLLFLFTLHPAAAQNYLTYEAAIAWALENHPVAITANAVEARGAAEALSARAMLDPKFDLNYDRKDFKGTEYFDYGQAELSWQSPLAVKISGGYQVAEGTFLNDERTIPTAGQAYLAIKLPLLRGLLIDATRIGLRRGELAEDRQRALANVIRNELRYDLAVRYLEWVFALQAVEINQEIADFIAIRLENTRQYFQLGDKPAIDTLEASVALGLQLQTILQAQVDADLARGALSELYWPLEATDLPVLTSDLLTVIPVFTTWQNHPELNQLSLLLTDASLARDLKREELKPELNLSYYLLGDGFAIPETQGGSAFSEAYKFGVTASYPLLNRKARAGVQLGELKVIESEAKLAGKQQSLEVKANAYANAVAVYTEQLIAVDLLVEQAGQLLSAERELFNLGESTQFIVNGREQSFLKAQLTAAKLAFARSKAVAVYRYLVAEW
jgi:outer membrane protein TolC